MLLGLEIRSFFPQRHGCDRFVERAMRQGGEGFVFNGFERGAMEFGFRKFGKSFERASGQQGVMRSSKQVKPPAKGIIFDLSEIYEGVAGHGF